jgi:hypothetical protein
MIDHLRKLGDDVFNRLPKACLVWFTDISTIGEHDAQCYGIVRTVGARAKSEAFTPGCRLSATIAAFSAAVHRRRRGVPVISSIRAILAAFVPVLMHGTSLALPIPTTRQPASSSQPANPHVRTAR